MLARARRGDRRGLRHARACPAASRRTWASTAWSCSTAWRCVVKSPGVPNEAPVIAAARERGLPVLGELELAWRLLPNRFVAVTGTNGKTTTAELLGAIWREAGLPVALAGQRGHAAVVAGRATVDPRPRSSARCRASRSRTPRRSRPTRALLLNIDRGPPRPARHASRPTARRSCACSRNQTPEQVAVVPPGVEVPGAARRVEFGAAAAAAPSEIRLRGAHNLENAMRRRGRGDRVGRARRGGGARAARRSPACRTGSRRSAGRTACST